MVDKTLQANTRILNKRNDKNADMLRSDKTLVEGVTVIKNLVQRQTNNRFKRREKWKVINMQFHFLSVDRKYLTFLTRPSTGENLWI